mmetsp:Transcript_136465/g.193021  ORF Transcript_136465/g.193021 Transcript_136465/m.193021 type:complete len:158 (-) Transcript_136465:70-543(-)
MTDLVALQRLLFAPAVGTSVILFSTISGIKAFATARYAIKGFEHPYAPWKENQSDAKILRGFKATQNSAEWTTYTLPFVWILSVYGPAVPVVGPYTEFAVGALCCVYAYGNVRYVPAYMESAEARITPFKIRTNAFKGLAFGSLIALSFSAYAIVRS